MSDVHARAERLRVFGTSVGASTERSVGGMKTHAALNISHKLSCVLHPP